MEEGVPPEQGLPSEQGSAPVLGPGEVAGLRNLSSAGYLALICARQACSEHADADWPAAQGMTPLQFAQRLLALGMMMRGPNAPATCSDDRLPADWLDCDVVAEIGILLRERAVSYKTVWMAEGRRLFGLDDLRGAKGAFMKHVSREAFGALDSEGWRWLGQCHADGDDDIEAIQCYRKAVALDDSNAHAHVLLGISLVNELDTTQACHHLHCFLVNSPQYAALGSVADTSLFGLKSFFKQACSALPSDPHLRMVLAVLYVASMEYAAAAVEFKAAVELDDENYSMWNKLGATLANAGQSEDALRCYQRALRTRPSFVRGWCNAGLSFMGMGRYDDAICHLLKALRLNPDVPNTWRQLETALHLSGTHRHLIVACSNRDLKAFEEEFDVTRSLSAVLEEFDV